MTIDCADGDDDNGHKAAPTSPDIAAINRVFYNALWRKARLEPPDRFNTWPLVSELLPSSPARLEIGPGLRPRLPIAGTHVIDISAPVIEQLNARGGIGTPGEVGTLPFRDGEFDLVCAFDVIEHVEDDRRVFREVSRVLKDDGVLICSVPLYAERWTEFDDWVGHARRYDPSELVAMMASNQLNVEKSAAFGMQPANPRLAEIRDVVARASPQVGDVLVQLGRHAAGHVVPETAATGERFHRHAGGGRSGPGVPARPAPNVASVYRRTNHGPAEAGHYVRADVRTCCRSAGLQACRRGRRSAEFLERRVRLPADHPAEAGHYVRVDVRTYGRAVRADVLS